MDFLREALKALPMVASSPLAFVGYLVTLLVWVVAYFRSKRFKLLLMRIKDIPESERSSIVQAEMGTVLPKSITAEQWLRSRQHQYYFIAFVLLLVTLIAVIAIAAWKGHAQLKIDSVQQITPIDNVQQQPKPNSQDLSGAKLELQQILPSQAQTHRYVFDITLRNPSDEPVTVTNMRVIFDPEEGGILASVEEISGTYIVHIDQKGAISTGPLGKQKAYAWYPSGQGRLYVKSPLSQSLKPKSIDRFRVIIEFPADYQFRGRMEQAVVEVFWNEKNYEKSAPIPLNKM